MRIDRIVFTTLALFLVDCGLDCDSKTENFSIDVTLHQSDIVEILRNLHEDSSDNLSCEDVCRYIYLHDRGWYISEVGSCEHKISAEAVMDPDADVGSIRCDGLGYETPCE